MSRMYQRTPRRKGYNPHDVIDLDYEEEIMEEDE